MSAERLRGIYAAVLRLFPGGFRDEYGDEMAWVFAQAVQEAAGRGRLALAGLLLRELRGLAGEGARQAVLALKRESDTTGAGGTAPAEKFLGLAAFLLPAAVLALAGVSTAAARVAVFTIVGVLGGLLLAGLARGLPRWSLPYLGLAGAAASLVCLFQWGADLLSAPALERLGLAHASGSGRVLLQALWAGMAWLMLLLVVGALLGLLALLGRLGGLVRSLRQDWTLASYTLYSGVLAGVVLSPLLPGAAYSPAQKPYLLLAAAGLGLGACLYHSAGRPVVRWLGLLVGLSLALPACGLGGLTLLPVLEQVSLPGRGPLFEWAWLAALLLAPALLKRLPLPGGSLGSPAAG